MAMADLLGGQVPLFLDPPPNLIQPAKAGRIRLIGVASEKRLPILESRQHRLGHVAKVRFGDRLAQRDQPPEHQCCERKHERRGEQRALDEIRPECRTGCLVKPKFFFDVECAEVAKRNRNLSSDHGE